MSNYRLRVGEELIQLLDYNPETGELKWKLVVSRKRPNLAAGCINKDGYLVVTYCGLQFFGHILAWRIHKGVWPKNMIDHKNRKPAENQIENLREATNRENQLNSKIQDNPLLGISKQGKKWRVLGRRPKRKSLGYYNTLEEAKAVRDEYYEIGGDK